MSTFYTLPPVGQDVRLLTHLVVREDAHVLYGFATEDERRLFRSLLKVSGVGPKIALALLSGISVEAFAHCVQQQDVGRAYARPRHRTQDRRAAARRDARPAERDPRRGQQRQSGACPSASPEAEAYGALVALGLQAG